MIVAPRHSPRRLEAERLLREGVSVPEVARRSKMAEGTIYRLKTRLGLSPSAASSRRKSPQRLEAERLLREGMTVSDAAQSSGMSRMHVHSISVFLGIRPPRTTTQKSSRRIEAEHLLREGVTARETAQRSGMSERRIHQLRARLGIRSPPGARISAARAELAAKRRDQVTELLALGLSVSAIARRLGVSRGHVSQLRIKLGMQTAKPAKRRALESRRSTLAESVAVREDVNELWRLKTTSPVLVDAARAAGVPEPLSMFFNG